MRTTTNIAVFLVLLIVGSFGLAVSIVPIASAQDGELRLSDPTADASEKEELAESEEEFEEEAYETDDGPAVIRTVCEGRTIRRIVVEGVRRVEAEDVLASVRLRKGMTCRDIAVTSDARALWGRGLFDKLTIDAEPHGDDEITLVIRVEERPAIAKITLVGVDEVDEDDLREKITLQNGGILSTSKVKDQVTKIRDFYAEEGYFLANVRHEIKRIKNDNHEVHIRFIIDEGNEVSVRRIRFVGNHNIKAEALFEMMRTNETGFFSFFDSRNLFNPEYVKEDAMRLQAYYYDQGFLTMQAGEPRIELTSDRQHIDITIPIQEGPRYRIEEIKVQEIGTNGKPIEGLQSDDALRATVPSEAGDWFSRSQIGVGIQALTRLYRDEGYAFVQVRPQPKLDEKRRLVTVDVQILRGEPVKIERINLTGNSKTRDRVLRRELQILEGETYSQTKIEESKRRIMGLRYFERVDIAEERGSADDRIVLNVSVAERPTGTFQVGAGFSSLEQFLLTAQIQQQNLMGHGISLNLQVQLSAIRQNIQLALTEPAFLDTNWTLGGQVFKTIRQNSIFSRNSTGGGLTLGHPIYDRRLRFFINYKLEHVAIDSGGSGLFNLQGGGQAFNQFDRLPFRDLFREGYTSSMRFSLTWDSRTGTPVTTTGGLFTSYSVEIADKMLGSQQNFIRQNAFARYYHSLGKLPFGKNGWGPFILRGNVEFGMINSTRDQTVPIYERYYLGGIFNVRGYPYFQLGPRGAVTGSYDPNDNVRSTGTAFGGNIQAFYQLELEFPILDALNLRGVVFTDGGNSWNLDDYLCQVPEASVQDRTTSPCGVSPFAIRTSWGFGVRWFSPLGPLRFEFGLPINKRAHEDALRFEFTIGNSF